MTSQSLEKQTLGSLEQGCCYLADMNPPRRSKPGKVRPVVIIQAADILKAGSPGVVVVPLTSQLADENILRVRVSPSPELKLQKPSDALLDQIHTLDRELLLDGLGSLNATEWEKVQKGVKFLLGF